MRKFLVSAPQALLAAVLLLDTPLAHAQDSGKMTGGKTHAGPAASDCCVMKDGKMMIMKGGKMMPMAQDMTMSDGTVCMTDGTCKMKDGKTMTMKNGQCIMMDGKMTTMSAMKKGSKMKHSGKMGDMKM